MIKNLTQIVVLIIQTKFRKLQQSDINHFKHNLTLTIATFYAII